MIANEDCIVIPKNHIALGKWNDELKQVDITQTKGRLQIKKSGQLKNLQRALLLMQRGELAVYNLEIALCIQESFCRFFSKASELELYLLYSFLSTIGFKFGKDLKRVTEKKGAIGDKFKSPSKKKLKGREIAVISAPTKCTSQADDSTLEEDKNEKVSRAVFIDNIYKSGPSDSCSSSSSSSSSSALNTSPLKKDISYRLFRLDEPNQSIPKAMYCIGTETHSSLPALLATDGKMATKFYTFEMRSHIPCPTSFKKFSKLKGNPKSDYYD